MNNIKLLTIVILVTSALLCLAGIKKRGPSDKVIQLTGHFYTWIPYQITHPEGNSLELKADTSRVYMGHRTHYENKKTSIFSIRRAGDHLLTIYDSLSRQPILFKMKAKTPPLTIEFSSKSGGIPYRSGGAIGIKKILEGGGLICNVLNFDLDLTLPVKQFEMVFYVDNELKTIHSKGRLPILSDEQREAIRQIKESTILIFRNILVKNHVGEEIEAPPFILLLEV